MHHRRDFSISTRGVFYKCQRGNGKYIWVQIAGRDDKRNQRHKFTNTPVTRKPGTIYQLVITKWSVEKFEAINIRKDGSIIWTSTNARAVKNKAGKVLYFEGFVTDITKQKKSGKRII
ncbi:MAG: PAS domain-containing protein [Anaerolineales bacterium]|nr:PAS domain-containing protein [Anaerolineales bacterium]